MKIKKLPKMRLLKQHKVVYGWAKTKDKKWVVVQSVSVYEIKTERGRKKCH